MNKTKIEWADMTWNPVTGCMHGCEYCYARKLAERFGTGKYNPCGVPSPIDEIELATGETIFELESALGGEPYPQNFAPTFHRYRLNDPQRKTKSQTIFVCSMADLFGEWVPDEWIKEVFDACEKAPQHRYLFLTKNPRRYNEFYYSKGFPYNKNFWFGSTIARPNQEFTWFKDTAYHSFISIEPLLEPMGEIVSNHMPEWAIIGAETGNRKGKVIPQKEWVMDIVKGLDQAEVPVFMKESLVPIVGEANMRREFPWEVIK